MNHRTIVMSAAVAVMISACSAGPGDAASTPSPAAPAVTTTTPAPGPDAFLADVAKSGFGNKDETDPAFISVGNQTCEAFNDGVSYGDQLTAYETSDANPTQVQADVVIRSAVRNLCPEYANMLP